MTIKIELLRGFAEVARSGNLSDAANRLGRTPSAVSMMLKQLETHLGEPLFETDRKNKLTALGVFVLDQAERELQQFDNTVKVIESFANARRGHVRIATVPSVAGTIIPALFSNYMDDFENLEIELRDMDSASILHELARGRIDIGVATLGDDRHGFESRLLLTDRFGVIASPKHPISKSSAPVEWDEFQNTCLIANNLSASITDPHSRRLHENALLAAHNLTSSLSMVRANIGVTILPEMASKAVQASNLVFRPLADRSIQREVHLLRKSETAQSPAARLLEDRLMQTASVMGEGHAI